MILLDLFCCEGGAGVGYSRAGFTVIGVDLFKHRDDNGRVRGFSRSRYPFAAYQGDVLAVLDMLLAGVEVAFTHHDGRVEYIGLDDIDVIHASPPCQAYSITANGHSVDHPRLIDPVRERLIAMGKPYVIENVEGAPLLDPITLCWSMFNRDGSVLDDDGTPLRMERHRIFESNVHLNVPPHEAHNKAVQVAGSYGGARRDKEEARHVRHGGYVPSKAVQQQLLDIDWMTVGGMYQCIPPVYAMWVGVQMKRAAESRVRADVGAA